MIDPSREDFEISFVKKMPLTVRGSIGGAFKFDLNATDEEEEVSEKGRGSIGCQFGHKKSTPGHRAKQASADYEKEALAKEGSDTLQKAAKEMSISGTQARNTPSGAA